MIARIVAAIVFVVALVFVVRGWMNTSGKDAPGDPKALKISIHVNKADPDGTKRVKPVQISFMNLSAQPVRILKPVLGSQKGWNLPFYTLSIEDPFGQQLPVDPNSMVEAPSANPKWPDDYVVEIAPGSSYEMDIDFFRSLSLPGQYRLSFSYTYDPAKQGTLGDANGMAYPHGLWIGSVSSGVITSDLTAWTIDPETRRRGE